MNTVRYTLFFDEAGATDTAHFGGKASSLAILYQQMQQLNIQVPYGFTSTAQGFHLFISHNALQPVIDAAMAEYLQYRTVDHLQRASQIIRHAIEQGEFPTAMAAEILHNYEQLHQITCNQCNSVQKKTDKASNIPENLVTHWRYPHYPLTPSETSASCMWSVAVRSSATSEDSPTASFAGQQETLLNVAGTQNLLAAIKQCFSSLYTPRAIIYRLEHGFDYKRIALSAVIQQMVRSDEGAAGVIFTLEPESGFRDIIAITGSYGLGELVVQGTVTPDSWYVHKPTLQEGYPSICTTTLGEKTKRLRFEGINHTQEEDIIKNLQAIFCLTPEQVLSLAKQALAIEQLYSTKQGSWCPMDIEWAMDGIDQQLYIVQARPETVHSRQDHSTITLTSVAGGQERTVLAKGISIGQGAVSGTVQKIIDVHDIAQFVPGNILVTQMTDPDWVPVLQQARAIITAQGGRTCHAAIVSRELGIPAVVGLGNIDMLHNGQTITLDCSTGLEASIYAGELPITKAVCKLADLPSSPVPYFLNVGQPERAFSLASYPVNGVGLARTEFIIANCIGMHPMAAVHPEVITDPSVIQQISTLTAAYETPAQYVVQTLAQQIATIAAAFWPRQVIVRTSDFKSNEYRNLLAGSYFEPVEENPMLGLRGASRYVNAQYKEAFALECQALVMARNNVGLRNISIMLPFVRTTEELKASLELLAQHGLIREDNGLKLYMMCELPANVFQLTSLQGLIDGVSIGSNDLTQLMLGVDRDCAQVASLYNERDPAVMQMMFTAIKNAHAAGLTIGICGQGPSDFPDLAQQLITAGIDYLSLNPDAVISLLRPDCGR